MTTTVACLHCPDQLRPAGTGAFHTAPVHIGTGDTACHNRRGDSAEPDLWGVLPNGGTDWLFGRHPDHTSRPGKPAPDTSGELMHRNDIRAALIGTAAGALTIATLIAWSEFDASYRIADLIARVRMTPEQRRECDELRDLAARDRDYADRNAVKITLPDARDQLSADEIADLVAMTPEDLLNDAARTRAALDYRGGTYVSGEWSANNDHMSVLSGEVARRFAAGRLSPLEHAQLALAQRYIHGSTTHLLPELRERSQRM